MRAADVVTASILILFGGLVLVDATRLGFGWGTDGPQSGFFPFWLALLMVLACVLIVIQAMRESSQRPFVDRAKLAPVLKDSGRPWRRWRSCKRSVSMSRRQFTWVSTCVGSAVTHG